jgi:hypothetical protein
MSELNSCGQDDRIVGGAFITTKTPPKCYKCNQNLAVLSGTHPQCRDCLVAAFDKRFKGNLRNKLGIMRESRVIAAVSCGSSSLAMAHLLKRALFEANKRMLFSVVVVYIDESEIWTRHAGGTEHFEELRDRVNSVLEELSGSFTIVRVAANTERIFQEFEQKDNEKISLSEKQEIVDRVRLEKLFCIAEEHQAQMILLGDCADRIAISTIRATAQGKGKQVAQLAKYVQSHPSNQIQLGYPMKDFFSRDLAMLNRIYRTSPTSLPTFCSRKGPKEGGIGHLCENFITHLQSRFPNTVSNILRTAEKLEVTTL